METPKTPPPLPTSGRKAVIVLMAGSIFLGGLVLLASAGKVRVAMEDRGVLRDITRFLDQTAPYGWSEEMNERALAEGLFIEPVGEGVAVAVQVTLEDGECFYASNSALSGDADTIWEVRRVPCF